LATTALAGDEDIGIAGSDAGDELIDLPHAAAGEDGGELLLGLLELARELGGAGDELLAILDQLALLEGALDDVEELLRGVGLRDEMEGAKLDGLDGVAEGVLGGDDDDEDVRVALLDGAEGLETGGVREAEVEEDEIGAGFPDQCEAGTGGAGELHVIAIPLEQGLQRQEDRTLIVDDYNFAH